MDEPSSCESAPKRARIDSAEPSPEAHAQRCTALPAAAADPTTRSRTSAGADLLVPAPPAMPYAPPLSVLLVGDGNLSFGAAVVRQRGGGRGVVVTSYESHPDLVAKYAETAAIIDELVAAGATVAHGVDATRLPESLWAAGVDKAARFDRVVFQFPLVPPPTSRDEYRTRPDPIVTNRMMIRTFLGQAGTLLRAGASEVHIASKDVKPYAWWRIETLVPPGSPLSYCHRYPFDASLYPGYESRKPTNVHDDRVESFPFTNCFTYVYRPRPEGAPPDAPPPDRGPLYCTLCHTQTTGAQNLADHRRGKRHRLFAAIEERWAAALAALEDAPVE